MHACIWVGFRKQRSKTWGWTCDLFRKAVPAVTLAIRNRLGKRPKIVELHEEMHSVKEFLIQLVTRGLQMHLKRHYAKLIEGNVNRRVGKSAGKETSNIAKSFSIHLELYSFGQIEKSNAKAYNHVLSIQGKTGEAQNVWVTHMSYLEGMESFRPMQMRTSIYTSFLACPRLGTADERRLVSHSRTTQHLTITSSGNKVFQQPSRILVSNRQTPV